MTRSDDKQSIKPEPLVISRRFAAPRDLVFKAWSTAEAAYNLAGGVTGTAGSTYGDTRAALDAENRAARSIADTIKTRLAAYLSNAA